MPTTPPAYQQAAQFSVDAAQGYSDALRHIAETVAASENEKLGLYGSPQQVETGDFGADVLYGLGGYIPGTSFGREGAAFASAAAAYPTFTSQILAQNAALQNQSLALQRASGAPSGSSDEGLTPYQAASLQFRAMEFERGLDEDARQEELDWAKFEAEQEQQAQENQANAAVWGITLQMLGFSPGEIKKLLPSLVGGGTSGLGTISGIAGDKAAAAGKKAKDKQSYVSNLTGSIGSAFKDAASGPGLSKRQLFNATYSAVVTSFQGPNGKYKFGVTDNFVRNKVNAYVNSHFSSYRAGKPPKPVASAKNRNSTIKSMGRSIGSLYKDFLSSRPETSGFQGFGGTGAKKNPNYGAAWGAIYSGLKASYQGPGGKWMNGVKDTLVRRKINAFLAARGIRPKNRRMNPATGLYR